MDLDASSRRSALEGRFSTCLLLSKSLQCSSHEACRGQCCSVKGALKEVELSCVLMCALRKVQSRSSCNIDVVAEVSASLLQSIPEGCPGTGKMLCAASVWSTVKHSGFRVPRTPYTHIADIAGGACSHAIILSSDMSSVEHSRARHHSSPGVRPAGPWKHELEALMYEGSKRHRSVLCSAAQLGCRRQTHLLQLEAVILCRTSSDPAHAPDVKALLEGCVSIAVAACRLQVSARSATCCAWPTAEHRGSTPATWYTVCHGQATICWARHQPCCA